MENANTPFRQTTTCLVTRRGQLPRESVAGNARLEKNCIILVGAKSVARTTAERHRKGQCLEAYHDCNTRATPPRSQPRVKKGVSSQNCYERGMHRAHPRYAIDSRQIAAREYKKVMSSNVSLESPLTIL